MARSEQGPHEVIEEVPARPLRQRPSRDDGDDEPGRSRGVCTGYLFTEQIIKGIDEIESIRIEKNRMSVITKNLFKVLGPKKTILSGCGGSTSYIDTEKLPKITSDYYDSPERRSGLR